MEDPSMRCAVKLIALAIVMGVASSALARPSFVAVDQSAPAAKSNEPAAGNAGASRSGESWRYRRHGGLWWYWLPSEKWVYWTADRWNAYESHATSQFRAARPPRSSSYPADQGNWGPVRYNSYGQPQYPYSQRKSGLRQLGPVPAMGGVRSLPGWGGER
jgi:hypothetical protein